MEPLEHRRAEALTRQTEKMDAVANVARSIAHDFNNLLTAILAYSDSLISQVPAQSPLRAELVEIRKAGERLSTMTRQLHTVGRRQPSANARPANLNVVMAGLEPRLRRTMGEHVDVGVQLTSEIAVVQIDPTQFEQAILNLALNARDAMPAGGSLTLRTAADDAEVSLTIADTGCGMDANTQARAFEPFFTTKEAGQGIGLGLALVYAIVRQGGGRIEIDSELGRGTTIKIFLPRMEADDVEAMEQATPATADADAHETILLVEDEELVRQMAVLTLERRGYQVLVARDGTDAVARANAHAGAIDLLVADLVMPRLGGEELAHALREKRPKMRVLYMAGYGDQPFVPPDRPGGEPAAVLQKPYVATALADKVREALQRPN